MSSWNIGSPAGLGRDYRAGQKASARPIEGRARIMTEYAPDKPCRQREHLGEAMMMVEKHSRLARYVRLDLRRVCIDDSLRGFSGIIRQEHQVEITRGNLSFRGHSR